MYSCSTIISFCLAPCLTDVLLTDAQVMEEEGNPSMEAFLKVKRLLSGHSVIQARYISLMLASG